MTCSEDPDQTAPRLLLKEQSDLRLHIFVSLISPNLDFYGIQHFKHYAYYWFWNFFVTG